MSNAQTASRKPFVLLDRAESQQYTIVRRHAGQLRRFDIRPSRSSWPEPHW